MFMCRQLKKGPNGAHAGGQSYSTSKNGAKAVTAPSLNDVFVVSKTSSKQSEINLSALQPNSDNYSAKEKTSKEVNQIQEKTLLNDKQKLASSLPNSARDANKETLLTANGHSNHVLKNKTNQNNTKELNELNKAQNEQNFITTKLAATAVAEDRKENIHSSNTVNTKYFTSEIEFTDENNVVIKKKERHNKKRPSKEYLITSDSDQTDHDDVSNQECHSKTESVANAELKNRVRKHSTSLFSDRENTANDKPSKAELEFSKEFIRDLNKSSPKQKNDANLNTSTNETTPRLTPPSDAASKPPVHQLKERKRRPISAGTTNAATLSINVQAPTAEAINLQQGSNHPSINDNIQRSPTDSPKTQQQQQLLTIRERRHSVGHSMIVVDDADDGTSSSPHAHSTNLPEVGVTSISHLSFTLPPLQSKPQQTNHKPKTDKSAKKRDNDKTASQSKEHVLQSLEPLYNVQDIKSVANSNQNNQISAAKNANHVQSETKYHRPRTISRSSSRDDELDDGKRTREPKDLNASLTSLSDKKVVETNSERKNENEENKKRSRELKDINASLSSLSDRKVSATNSGHKNENGENNEMMHELKEPSASLTSASDKKATENRLGHKSGNERIRESKDINASLTSLSDKKDAIKISEHSNEETLKEKRLSRSRARRDSSVTSTENNEKETRKVKDNTKDFNKTISSMEVSHAETSQQHKFSENERTTPKDLNTVRGTDRPQSGSRNEHSQRDRSRKRTDSISKHKDLNDSTSVINAKQNDEGSIGTRARQNDESDNESKRSHSRRSSFSLFPKAE